MAGYVWRSKQTFDFELMHPDVRREWILYLRKNELSHRTYLKLGPTIDERYREPERIPPVTYISDARWYGVEPVPTVQAVSA